MQVMQEQAGSSVCLAGRLPPLNQSHQSHLGVLPRETLNPES